MKLSIPAAAIGSIADGRLTTAAPSPVVDLSKDLEEAKNLNESPGARAVLDAARGTPSIRTAMVVEDGKVVASYVRDDVDSEKPVEVNSLAKSVTSLLIGILLDEGTIALDETLGDIFSNDSVWEDVPDADFRKAITIEQMLTMTSRLSFSFDYFTQDFLADICENGQKAWLRAPSIGPKGEASYLAVSDILSYVIFEKAGISPRELLAEKVLPFLGIQDSEMDWKNFEQLENFDQYCPAGAPERPESAFDGIYLTAPQMAKFGMLYLARGAVGEDKRVISEGYVNDSLTEHTAIGGSGYGYLWHKSPVEIADSSEYWSAFGLDHQVVSINYELGRVTVQQSDEDDEREGMASYPGDPAFVGLDPSLSFQSAESNLRGVGGGAGPVSSEQID